MHVHVDCATVRRNASRVRERVDGSLVASVKDVAAHPAVVDAVLAAGVDALGVARVEHLRTLADRDAPAVLLRPPALDAVPAVVEAADRSIQADLAVAERAGEEARRRGRTHRVLPAVDAGDSREGVALDRAPAVIDRLAGLPGLELDRVAVTLGCFGDRPDPAAVRRVADRLPERALSVGGSGLLLAHDSLPAAVDEVRVGDALLTGRWRDTPVEWLEQGAVELRAEVLTARPDGAVVDVGHATSDPRFLHPRDPLTVERWSSGQTVVGGADLDPGEEVAFEMRAPAIARTFAAVGADRTTVASAR